MNNLPAAKIKMMQASMRCLVFGLLGLLPIVGLPFALAALWMSGSACRWEMKFWNPAKVHRILGLTCATIGALVWSLVDVIVIYRACSRHDSF